MVWYGSMALPSINGMVEQTNPYVVNRLYQGTVQYGTILIPIHCTMLRCQKVGHQIAGTHDTHHTVGIVHDEQPIESKLSKVFKDTLQCM